MNVQRIAKAVLGTSITWGLVWSLLSVPSLLSVLKVELLGVTTSELVWSWATSSWLQAFAQGAVMGAGFALLLLVMSKRVRSFDRLSAALVSVLGAVAAVGACALALGSALSLLNALIVGALGASSAFASLVIARRAPEAPLLERATESLELPRAWRSITPTTRRHAVPPSSHIGDGT